MDKLVLSSVFAIVIVMCLSEYAEGGCECSKYRKESFSMRHFDKCYFKCIKGGMNQ